MDPDANISKSQISRWFPDTLPWSIPASTTSVTHVRVFVDALESMGVVYTRVLERCGIDPSALDDPEQRLPESKVALLWPTAANLTEDPSVHSNPDLLKVHERYASNRLRQLHAGGVAGRVQGLLASMLEHGPIALHELARRLHMSPRTLQRRLAEESTSYNTILDAMRQEVALDELERGDTPLAEIAYMTGFANPSAFYRAVHRWTGKTPLACRRDHLHR